MNNTEDTNRAGNDINAGVTSDVSHSNMDIEGMLCDNDLRDPLQILKLLKMKYCDNITIAQLNINSIRNKFDHRSIVQGYVDILIITEAKLDSTFPTSLFMIDGYTIPYRR